MDERLRTIGEFTDYDGMLAIVRSRVQECRSPASSSTTLPAYRAAICRNSLGAAGAAHRPYFHGAAIFRPRCSLCDDRRSGGDRAMRKQLKPRNGSYVRAAHASS